MSSRRLRCRSRRCASRLGRRSAIVGSAIRSDRPRRCCLQRVGMPPTPTRSGSPRDCARSSGPSPPRPRRHSPRSGTASRRKRRCRHCAWRRPRPRRPCSDSGMPAKRPSRSWRAASPPATKRTPAALAEAAAAVADAGSQLEARRASVLAAAEGSLAAQQREGAAVDRAREAQAILARLQAEADALSRMLAGSAEENSDRPPVLSLLEVPEGFEAATAALFDGELSAPLLPSDREARDVTSGWVALAPLAETAALPAGVHAFAPEIGAPAALARRLGQAGWVDNETAGWELQPQLRPGQSLVDRDGRLWRWDGFTRLAPATSATAEKLRQRNRLAALTGEIDGVSASAREAAELAAAARGAREAAAVAERGAIAELRGSEERLANARAAEAELTRR